jgi:hypothetical protein
MRLLISAFYCVKEYLSKRYVEFAVFFAFALMIMVLSFYFSKFHYGLSSDQDTWGQFGDFLGGTLNPLLGFISVLVLVATLNTQRVELKEARNAAVEGNKILEAQLRAMHLQSLENTFFKMLEELKSDGCFIACKSDNADRLLFRAVYSYVTVGEVALKERGFASRNIYFSKMSDGAITFGEYKHIVLDKVVGLVELAKHLNNNQIHFGVLQSVVGPSLMASLIHFSKYELPEYYPVFSSCKRLLRGVASILIFDDEIARDFLDGESMEKYFKEKDGNLVKIRRLVALKESKFKSGSN